MATILAEGLDKVQGVLQANEKDIMGDLHLLLVLRGIVNSSFE